MKKITIIAIAVIGLFLLASNSFASVVFQDNFNDNSLNTTAWTANVASGSTLQEVNGRIEITQGTSAGATYLIFNTPVAGDFFAQVDYELLDWPANNKERSAINASLGAQPGAVERISDSSYGGEVYLTHFGDGPTGSTSTSDTNGRLKVTRTGSILSGYYWNGSSWSLIHTYNSASTADAELKLQIWRDNAANQQVKVAFDNFQLNAVPEPASLSFLGLGLAGLLRLKRRKT